jgi:iron complex transport system ATP-binding protein
LILSGDFARVFAAEDVRFDLEAGHFELRRPAQRFVALEGEGARAAWTKRALDRVGIGIDQSADRTVGVDAAGWRLDGQAHPSIASLLRAL